MFYKVIILIKMINGIKKNIKTYNNLNKMIKKNQNLNIKMKYMQHNLQKKIMI